MLAESAFRRVDHELDLAVLDRVDDIGPAFVHLQDRLGLNAVAAEALVRTVRCFDPKAEFLKLPRYL